MEPITNIPMDNQPVNNTRASVIVIIAILALVVGAGLTWVYWDTITTSQKNDLQSQIDTLKASLAAASPTPVASPSASATPTASASPTVSPSATSNTLDQTYINNYVHFAISYPGNWKWSFNANTAFAGMLQDNLNAAATDTPSFTIGVTASVKDNSPATAQDYITQLGKNMGLTLKTETTTVNGRTAVAYIDPAGRKGGYTGGSYNIVLIPGNGYDYEIGFPNQQAATSLTANQQAVLNSFTINK